MPSGCWGGPAGPDPPTCGRLYSHNGGRPLAGTSVLNDLRERPPPHPNAWLRTAPRRAHNRKYSRFRSRYRNNRLVSPRYTANAIQTYHAGASRGANGFTASATRS